MAQLKTMKIFTSRSLALLFFCSVFVVITHAQPCFLPAVSSSGGYIFQPKHSAVADFNNDGKLDLAFANNSTFYGASVLLGSGTGSFTSVPAWFPVGYNPEKIVSGDFNNDGNNDVVLIGANNSTTHLVSLLKGLGTGSFSPVSTITLTADNSLVGWDLNAGDYNGDGNLDLAYVKLLPTYSSSLTCLLGNGLGAFPTITTFSVAGFDMCTGDFNKDGKSDVAIKSSNGSSGFYGITVRFGAASNPLSTVNTYSMSVSSGPISTGDFNGDSNLDLAVMVSGSVTIVGGSPTGTFAAVGTYSTGGTTVIDYNVDGIHDLFGASPIGTKSLYGSSTNTMTPGIHSYTYTGGSGLTTTSVGDFTSDGLPDVVITTYSASVNTLSILKSGLQQFSVNSGTICSGKTFTMNPTGAVSYSYSGGSSTVSPTTTSVYTVTGQFAQGCNNVATSTVNVLSLPTIALSNGTVCTGESYTITPSGAVTYTYSNGNIVTPAATSIYTVSGTGTNNCINSNTVSVTVLTVQTPSICLVTLDSLANNNEIYWEKTLYTNVDSFIIHREVSTNIYKRIGAVSVNAFSMYTDTNRSIGPANGNPNFTAYRYKLQIRNTCGNYGALSLWHETIFVQDQLNGNFNWNAYAIENSTTPVANYNLKRVNLTNGAETLVGSTTNNIFTDPQYATLSVSQNIKWFVDATGFNCNPTQRVMAQKIKTKSNHANDKVVTGLNSHDFSKNLLVYPNPASSKVTVEIGIFRANTSLQLTDVLGKVIITQSVTEKTSEIATDNLTPGVYFLTLYLNHKKLATKKLVIE